jgi:hypothetical protein
VIDEAKKYARAKGKSLSGMVENYLRSLSATTGRKGEKHAPPVARLMGSVQLPDKFNYKKDLAAAVTRKHRQ